MGAPLIQDPANPPILGYKMRYNLKTKVGEIYYGSSKKDNQTFNGVEIRRQKDGDILIARGDFSTCDHAPGQALLLLQPPHDPGTQVQGALRPHRHERRRRARGHPAHDGDAAWAAGADRACCSPSSAATRPRGSTCRGLGYYWAINDYTDLLMSRGRHRGRTGHLRPDESQFHLPVQQTLRIQRIPGRHVLRERIRRDRIRAGAWTTPTTRTSPRIRSRP